MTMSTKAQTEARGLFSILRNPTPKHLVVTLITTILIVGEWRFGVIGGYERLVVALGSCMLVEFILSRFVLGRSVPLLSAYVSGTSVTLLLKPEAGLVWPFAMAGALAIASKYVLRWRGRHLWNPTNLSICILLLVASPVTAILSHEWGNQIGTNMVLWGYGLLVVSRAKVLPVTATYALSFLAFAGLRSGFDLHAFKTEASPLTGVMYQLFCFFMITDPATTIRSKQGRLVVAFLIAFAEHLMRLGIEAEVAWLMPFASAPALFALFFIGPIAMFVWLEWNARMAGRGPEPSAAPRGSAA